MIFKRLYEDNISGKLTDERFHKLSTDYEAETDSVHWADSNMKGKSVNGIRYAYVQYDAVKGIDWFVDAFCRKKYGATIYRLREDIMYK